METQLTRLPVWRIGNGLTTRGRLQQVLIEPRRHEVVSLEGPHTWGEYQHSSSSSTSQQIEHKHLHSGEIQGCPAVWPRPHTSKGQLLEFNQWRWYVHIHMSQIMPQQPFRLHGRSVRGYNARLSRHQQSRHVPRWASPESIEEDSALRASLPIRGWFDATRKRYQSPAVQQC